MRKVIAALNMTLDAFCDHTAGIPDEEIHDHYTNLLANGDTILYGRKTYELMGFWQTLLKEPAEEKSMNDFAVAINNIQKIVFSSTLKEIHWDTAQLATKPLEEVVLELKKQEGKAIYVGSRSLIIQLINTNLLDEFQLCIHPLIIGSGLSLFEDIKNQTFLKLTKTKIFKNGAIILYYQFNKA